MFSFFLKRKKSSAHTLQHHLHAYNLKTTSILTQNQLAMNTIFINYYHAALNNDFTRLKELHQQFFKQSTETCRNLHAHYSHINHP